MMTTAGNSAKCSINLNAGIDWCWKTGPKIFSWEFLSHVGKFILKTFSHLSTLRNKCRLGADQGIYVLSGTLRLALQLYPTSPMTKQSKALVSWAEGTAQTLCPGPEQRLLRTLPLGHPRGPVWGAELWVQHPADAPRGCPVRMCCHALQMPFCW